ncbi:MAG: YceI family protein [Solirubrobacteraceae bacterium]|jgi:polyisoprenoid-binding protein YceI
MSIEPGTYALGPENGQLAIHTGKHGAAAKAGHNLLIEVGAWSATIDVAADPGQTTLKLTADSRSLRVLEGTGSVHRLSDHDKQSIAETINDEVLKGTAITFASTSVRTAGDGTMTVSGDLELWGKARPVAFELAIGDDGQITGTARIKHTDHGVKPYSALFGTLKVNDEVDISIDARVPAAG